MSDCDSGEEDECDNVWFARFGPPSSPKAISHTEESLTHVATGRMRLNE